MKILIISSSRADYDLLYPVVLELKKEKIEYDFLITGSHLTKKFSSDNNNFKENKIKKKFLKISLKKNNSIFVFTDAMKKFNLFLNKNKPDLLLVLGDRFEIFSIVLSAAFKKIPIAHISGGELTVANLDDSIRHSITKFSHFHFVANNIYKKRVIQLGENPKTVFVTGGTGIDNIKKNYFYNKNQLENLLSFKFKRYNFIVTYLPVSYLDKKKSNKNEIKIILSSLCSFKNSNIFVTYPNIDEGSDEIIDIIKKFKKRYNNIKVFKYLGKEKYLSILKNFDCLIGNSSSGITEAPFLKIPTINIGERQKGRVKALSIIDCEAKKELIIKNIKIALTNKFKNKIARQKTYYGKGNSSQKIVKILQQISLKNILKKNFYDIASKKYE